TWYTSSIYFQLSSGELLTTIDAHYQSITRLSLSSDESILFTASTDGTVSCYLISEIISLDRDHTIAPLRKWKAHSLSVSGLSVSDGANPRIASCGLDHVATVHSVSLDEVLLKISADRPLTACVLDPAETRLFLGSDTGNIAQINLYALGDARDLLVQVADEKNERVPVFSGHSSEITALAINGDGSLLASGDSSGKYTIWEICSRQCLKVSSMRGSVSTLQFVANWPSTHAAEHISAHPNFELQRVLTRGEKIPMIPHTGSDFNKEFWHGEVDRLITTVLQATASPTVSADSKKKKRKKKTKQGIDMKANGIDNAEDVIVIDDDDMDILEITETSSSSKPESGSNDNKKLIEMQRKEIQRLKKINAELYKFMASELTGK
ncbi:WD domain, G-beta repeat protein, partial [Ostertagia ostertagi]